MYLPGDCWRLKWASELSNRIHKLCNRKLAKYKAVSRMLDPQDLAAVYSLTKINEPLHKICNNFGMVPSPIFPFL